MLKNKNTTLKFHQNSIKPTDHSCYLFTLGHVNTMLLLASLPPYPGASHDPLSLMKVAHKSHKSLKYSLIKYRYTLRKKNADY